MKINRKVLFLGAIALGVWILSGIARFGLVSVVGNAMYPFVSNGSVLLVNRFVSENSEFKRGDIVLYRNPMGETTVGLARVVGLPGEEIEIKDDKVFIGEKKLYEEEYLLPEIETQVVKKDYEQLKLRQREYYLMGDNRSISQDSRYFGPVSRSEIVGKIVGVVWKKL